MKKKATTKAKDKLGYEIVEKEIEFKDPIRGLIKQKIKVKIYPPQPAPEPLKYGLELNLGDEPHDD